MIAGSITVTGSTSTSITIRLSSIADATYYRIAYRKSSETSPTLVDISGRVYTITGLSPATEYAINYRGCNADGMGPYMDAPVLQSTAAPLSLWSWTASNGSAAAEQVKAAYQAVTTKGKTADFSRLVWNDLVDNTLSALVESGLSWDNIYTKLSDAKMTAAGDALTAKRFNSLVKNLRYPWMYWACKPARNGYLGRLAVSSGDIVYGAYLLELAHILNVMVDAVGELGAGYADLLRHSNTIAMQSLWSAKLRAPAADHLSHGNIISFSGQQALADPVSRHLSVSKNIAVSDSIKLSDPRSKGLLLRRVILPTADLALTADNQRELQSDAVILVGTDIVLAPVGSCPLTVLAVVRSGTDVALSQSDTCKMLADIISATRSDAALTGSPSTGLQVVLCSEITPDVVLGADASAHIAITDTHASRIISAGLSADASAHLAASVSGALLRGDADMTTYKAANMGVTNVIRAAGAYAALIVPRAARMSISQIAAISAIGSDLHMISPYAAKMAITDAVTVSLAGSSAALSTPVAVGMAITQAEDILRASFTAAMRSPLVARMAIDAAEALSAAFAFDLSAAQSAHMGLSDTAVTAAQGSFALNLPDSVGLLVSIVERLWLAQDCTLDTDAPAPMAVSGGSVSAIAVTLIWRQSLHMDGHTYSVTVSGTQELGAPNGDKLSVTDAIVSQCVAGLTAKPVVEPTSDWVIVDGTNIKIYRTYYNRLDDADSTKLLIDDAYYVDPVQVGSNLTITSEGYNDYGLEGDSENST